MVFFTKWGSGILLVNSVFCDEKWKTPVLWVWSLKSASSIGKMETQMNHIWPSVVVTWRQQSPLVKDRPSLCCIVFSPGENCSLSFGNEEPGKATVSQLKINPEAPESETAAPTGVVKPNNLFCTKWSLKPNKQHCPAPAQHDALWTAFTLAAALGGPVIYLFLCSRYLTFNTEQKQERALWFC